MSSSIDTVIVPTGRYPWNSIRKVRQFRDYKPPERKPCEGFDTETTRSGKVRILSDSRSTVIDPDIEDAMLFLTNRRRRFTTNVFYNLHFDVEVLAKLDRSFAEALAEDDKGEIPAVKDLSLGGWNVSYLPRKLLRIRPKNQRNKTYLFYDIAQFYRQSLEQAAETYLHEKPYLPKDHRDKLFKLYSLEEISRYCEKDADLRVDVTSPASVTDGSDVTFRIKVTNRGPGFTRYVLP